MSITDELREWFENAYNYGTGEDVFKRIPNPWFGWKNFIEQMLDRIDAEHEAACTESWMGGHDLWASVGNEEVMAEHGWVRLPVGEDGEYIHIGDEMETLIPQFAGEHCRVEYMTLLADGWEVDGDRPETMRHYRKPTLEDVLEKALNEAAMLDRSDGYWPSAADVTNLVNECAAKVREVMGDDNRD